jgi:hypothetical protein
VVFTRCATHFALGGFFADQFENEANFNAHFTNTGPEIWRQTNGDMDAFVMSAGSFAENPGFVCKRILMANFPPVVSQVLGGLLRGYRVS